MSTRQTINDETLIRRELELSHRRRTWGNAYGTDIDGIIIEYDHGQPVALIDYKHTDAIPNDITLQQYEQRSPSMSASMTAIRHLAAGCNIPALIIEYAPADTEPWRYRLHDLNTHRSTAWGDESQLIAWHTKLRTNQPAWPNT